ncbi:MAG: isochorismatase family protein [Humibacillus sp.]|nr:isochorismatase family protein [Humibacillus sp.]MDN5776364.1 isochorismatase family protein [Humibacillus sp.]
MSAAPSGHQEADDFGGHLVPGAHPAVLSVDLIRAYTDPSSPFYVGSMQPVRSAARVISVARQCGVPVLHTRVEYASDGSDGGHFVHKVGALRLLFGGGPLSEIVPETTPVAGEPVITKQYASAFFGTGLAETLRRQNVDTVIIVGVSTSGCIRASALDALQHGFVPLVVRQAVGDCDEAAHRANLRDLEAKYAEVVDEADAIDYLEERHAE